MPIYAYRCTTCGHAQDVLQKISDPLLSVCPACGAATFVKQVTAAGFQLKGSGWYVTDFRGDKKSAKPAEGDAAPAADRQGRPTAAPPTANGKDAAKGDAAQERAAPPRRRLRPPLRPRPRRRRPPRQGRHADAPAARRSRSTRQRVKKYLIAGLLVWLPLAVTIWVLQAVLGMLNGVFVWLLAGSQVVLPAGSHAFIEHAAAGARPRRRRDGDRPAADRHLRDQHRRPVVAAPGPSAAQRIPIVKSIYSSVKQVSDTLFSSSGNAFREAVLVQYPRAGCWTIAFVTGKPGGEVALHLRGDYLSVYVPTTPNPTSGFFLMLPRSRRDRAGDERRRGAEVRDLDGRRRARRRASIAARAGGAKSAGLSARPRSARRCDRRSRRASAAPAREAPTPTRILE